MQILKFKYQAEYLNKQDQAVIECMFRKLKAAKIDRIAIYDGSNTTQFEGGNLFKEAFEFIDGGAEDFGVTCFRGVECIGTLYCVLGNDDYSTIYDYSLKTEEIQQIADEIDQFCDKCFDAEYGE